VQKSNRTPEGKAWADQVRAQRAAYEALSNSKKTELEELEVFDAFAAVAQVDVDSGSGVNSQSPEPDIRCEVRGEVHYFELGEITDQSVARCTADALRYDEPRGTAFSQNEPFAYIIGKKRSRTYTTNGAPVELVLYYRNQSPPFPSHFAELLASSMADLEALVSSGPFQRVWILTLRKGRFFGNRRRKRFPPHLARTPSGYFSTKKFPTNSASIPDE
jgi:hypothetical protein